MSVHAHLDAIELAAAASSAPTGDLLVGPLARFFEHDGDQERARALRLVAELHDDGAAITLLRPLAEAAAALLAGLDAAADELLMHQDDPAAAMPARRLLALDRQVTAIAHAAAHLRQACEAAS